MILLLLFCYNTERINSAYATYHGRFGKTIGGLLQLTVNSSIGLLGEGNISYVLLAHSEMLILPMEYLLERKEQWNMELINYGLLELLNLRMIKMCFECGV